jgi:hypothetical protein
VSGEGEIPFALAHHLDIGVHFALGAVQPALGQRKIVPLESGVGASRYDEGFLGRQAICFLIVALGEREQLLRRIQVAER